MAGGKACKTFPMFKDLGDEIDVIQINVGDKDSQRIWAEQGYTLESPVDVEEDEEDEEEDEDEEGED